MNTSTPKLFAFLPERVEFWIGEVFAGDAAGHADAAEAEFLHGVLNLLRGEVWELQGRGRKATKRSGCDDAEFDQALVLDLDQLPAASRSARYQNGLMLSASTSTRSGPSAPAGRRHSTTIVRALRAGG
jgi:hypothetical protein